MKRFATFITFLSTLLLLQLAQAEDIILQLAPEAGAPVIARVDASEPAVQNAADILSSEPGDSGWKWTEYRTTMEGYVTTAAVGKNFDITTGALVHARPRVDADVLTVVEDGDSFAILSSDDKWTRVRFTKEVPVYFSRLPQLGLTSLSEIDPGIPEAAPEPQPIETPPSSQQSKETANIVVEPSATSTRAAPRTPEAPQAMPTRTLVGKLIRRHSAFGPRYPLRLVSNSGSRIAYVDMSQVFISDLRPYLDQQVYISGEVHPLVPGSRELVILARTIRLSN